MATSALIWARRFQCQTRSRIPSPNYQTSFSTFPPLERLEEKLVLELFNEERREKEKMKIYEK